jgi:NitT/TauT family transport system substrate-binding protein
MLRTLCIFLLTAMCSVASAAREAPLRIQLHWLHQAQFAGFYMALDRGLFKREGLTVELIPGGPGVNPIEAVQQGRADVAVAWMGEAWRHARSGPPLVNVAQIAQKSSLGLLCRTREGIVSFADLPGKTVGFWGLQDDALIRQMARSQGLDPQAIRFELQAPNAVDLISGKFPCVTAMAYNEKLLAEAAGLTDRETLWITPESIGLTHLEDGLYVRADRLHSAAFRDELARLLRALREGWAQTRLAPSLSIQYVLRHAPDADRQHQLHMLDATLSMIPADRPFGLLSLGQWDAEVSKLMVESPLPREEHENLWSHAVFNEWAEKEGKRKFLNPSPRHYLEQIDGGTFVNLAHFFAKILFGITGFLVAHRAGYGPWGKLVIALITPLGGGLLRDLLVGGENWPPKFLADPTVPVAIIVASLVIGAILRYRPALFDGKGFNALTRYGQLIVIPLIAMKSVLVAISGNLHWVWAILCAAIAVSGGGILRDLLMNKEPASMRLSAGIEVAAASGAAVLLAGLWWANQFENTPVPVYLSMAACAVVSVGVMLWGMRRPSVANGPAHIGADRKLSQL